ncbi:MAG: HAD hydrolase-like protein [Clostridia bacterium]|nr:HAD hydrolase-like protein [Clostridia bacterium]
MKYPCLVVDHDDTVVNSTATVHYPCFIQYTREFFPDYPGCTLEEYFLKNFDPGIVSLFMDEVGMTAEDMKHEEAYWNAFVQRHIPRAYDGMRQVLEEQKSRGGLVCVVSHSLGRNILRDWRENGLPEPDAVFGWDMPVERRKPHPWPLQEIMRRFALSPSDLLMLDDLKPGYDMARACGVPFAAAGWANDVKPIEEFMRQHCDFYFKTIEALRAFLLNE